jgi:hypothetical protein
LSDEERQALVLARISGAPPERPIALFGLGGYTFGDVAREIEEGTPLGMRLIDAECKLVGMLLTEASLPSLEGGVPERYASDGL